MTEPTTPEIIQTLTAILVAEHTNNDLTPTGKGNPLTPTTHTHPPHNPSPPTPRN